MVSHADTIRHLREFLSRPTIAPALRDEYLGLLDALVAENQQLRDALADIVALYDRPATGRRTTAAMVARAALGGRDA